MLAGSPPPPSGRCWAKLATANITLSASPAACAFRVHSFRPCKSRRYRRGPRCSLRCVTRQVYELLCFSKCLLLRPGGHERAIAFSTLSHSRSPLRVPLADRRTPGVPEGSAAPGHAVCLPDIYWVDASASGKDEFRLPLMTNILVRPPAAVYGHRTVPDSDATHLGRTPSVALASGRFTCSFRIDSRPLPRRARITGL